MRLQVRHQTGYRYSQPVSYAIQTLRLTPQPYEGLNVIRWRVRGETRHDLPSFTDGFGNITHCHTVNRPHQAAAIFVEGEVETLATDGIIRGAAEPLPPLFFLRRTSLTAADTAIEALAARVKAHRPLDTLLALMSEVPARVEYRTGATTTVTTAAQALAVGAGVCQDHAHLFIAAARALAIPARYVGGYLWTGSGSEYEASHAWVEAYLGDFGWIGFDPSNGTRPTEAYVRASVGLDYWSAAPVRGIRRGEASESLDVMVRVTQARQEQ